MYMHPCLHVQARTLTHVPVKETASAQYLHKLGVDLEVRCRVTFLLCHALSLVNAAEQVLDSARNDASLFRRDVDVKARSHRVGLS